MFQKAGYEVVTTAFNVGNLDFKRAIEKFEDTVTDADIAVIYYAGHGLNIHGTNYLIPIDAKLASDRDANDETITLEQLVASVGGAKRLRVIIVDACRDNPFARTMKAQRGLGAVGPNSIDTLIAYAAKPGTTAQDGGGDHSPFATALIHNLFVPGLDIRLAFGRVRDEVLKKTGYMQEPFVYGSLGGGNIALVPAQSEPVVATDLAGEKNDYALVEKIGTKGAWQVFLNQHPTGFYADLARQQIEIAQERVNAPQEQAAKGQTDREAAQRAEVERQAEAKRRPDEAARQKAEQEAALAAAQRAARAAEQARLDAERQAARTREEETRQAAFAKRAAEAEAARKQAEAEAARKQAEAEAARKQAEAEAARKQAEAEAARTAEAEAARKQAEGDAARKQAEAEAAKQQAEAKAAKNRAEQQAAAEQARLAAAKQQAEAEAKKQAEQQAAAEQARLAAERAKQQAEAEAAKKQAEQQAAALAAAQQAAQAAEHARLDAEREAQARQEAACKNEQDRIDVLRTQGSKARDDLSQLQQSLTCERLRPLVTAALDQANALPDVNTPAQIRLAQQELTRLGCFSGNADGALGPATTSAVQHYESERGQPGESVDISDAFISELKAQSTRVCPLVCPKGTIADGEHCIAAEKPPRVAHQKDEEEPAAHTRAAHQKDEEEPATHTRAARQKDEEKPSQKSKPQLSRRNGDAEPSPPQQAKRERPAPRRVIEQASSYSGGGHSTGGAGMAIGVGF
jgi:hypothetical protein